MIVCLVSHKLLIAVLFYRWPLHCILAMSTLFYCSLIVILAMPTHLYYSSYGHSLILFYDRPICFILATATTCYSRYGHSCSRSSFVQAMVISFYSSYKFHSTYSHSVSLDRSYHRQKVERLKP